jgi:hypothetical protein
MAGPSPAMTEKMQAIELGENAMIKIWGRNTSSNVQKAMSAAPSARPRSPLTWR